MDINAPSQSQEPTVQRLAKHICAMLEKKDRKTHEVSLLNWSVANLAPNASIAMRRR